MINNSHPDNAISVIIYGIRRAAEVEKAVAEHVVEILKGVISNNISVHVHKYPQRAEDVAHGGVTYSDGGRKQR
jgi:CO dehydrogenase/acetyl-CoA synthase delta subunit